MATNIGPKIGIDGEKQYRDEINRIIQQAKTLDSEMKAVTSSFDKNTSAEEKATATGKVYDAQLENQRLRVEKLREMVERSAEATGENSTQTLKWQEALNNATAELNNMEQGTADAGEQVADLGQGFSQGATQAVKFGTVLAANITSQAIVAGVKALASAVKEVAQAFASCITDSAAFADNILTLSTNTGLSTDTLQEFQYMAQLTDTSLETITGSMTKLASKMDDARDGNKNAKKLFKQLGISVRDANKELRPTEEVFGEVIDALAQIENPAERDALAMDIFGKSAQELNSFIAQGSEGIAAFAQEAHDMGYVLDKDALSALGGVDDAMQRLKNTGTALKNQVGLALAPTITDLADQLMGFAQEIDWSNGLMGVMDSILAALPGALQVLLNSVGTLVDTITPVIPEVVNGIIDAIVENAPMLISGAIQMAVALGSGLLQAVPTIVQNIPTIVKAVLNGFATGLAPMLEQGQQAINDMWDGISGSAAMIWDNVTQFVQNNIIEPVKQKVRDMVNIGVNFVHGFWEGLSSSVEWLKQKISSWVGDVLSFIKRLFGIHSPSTVTAGYGKFLVEGLAQGINDNLQLAQRAWGNVTDAVGFNMGAGNHTVVGGNTINIYPQSLDESTIDYLFLRFNTKMGAMA